jgi:hypothetical protein
MLENPHFGHFLSEGGCLIDQHKVLPCAKIIVRDGDIFTGRGCHKMGKNFLLEYKPAIDAMDAGSLCLAILTFSMEA